MSRKSAQNFCKNGELKLQLVCRRNQKVSHVSIPFKIFATNTQSYNQIVSAIWRARVLRASSWSLLSADLIVNFS